MDARFLSILCLCAMFPFDEARPQDLDVAPVEGQPLAANVMRALRALDTLGAPIAGRDRTEIVSAARERDGAYLQTLLDPYVLAAVSINPELRVKVRRGPGAARIRQGAFTPVLIKVYNDGLVARRLRVDSPQAGPVYAGASLGILERQAQTALNRNPNLAGATDRFLAVEMATSAPMTERLSGLEVEYALALIYSHEAGRREATLTFDVGQGTQDLGFRAEVPVLFDVAPAVATQLKVRDHDGKPTTARLEFRDAEGRVYPPQAKRVAPDFFFQPHVYRADGQSVILPPGPLRMRASRGPEYWEEEREVQISSDGEAVIEVDLRRWVDPKEFGFFSGDHHIHGAGCSHYESPTQGVRPQDMFAQVKGEGLNVGCVLTWGPCFEFQRDYFSPVAQTISEPLTVLKYDLEISGFGSAALGHVCLLNLQDQTYPGSEGTKDKGWPTWTVPVLRWCKEQGGVTGYPHSALHVSPPDAGARLMERFDADGDGSLSVEESAKAVLPERRVDVDSNNDGVLSEPELIAASDRAADRLPNLALPAMDGGGAMEIVVSVPEGVCDFISAMDTARIPEWNTWYHLLNCGFPLKLSGETDFPCMSSRRVGAGRVYVQLGAQESVAFDDWVDGLGAGRSYVSDGYAHALAFSVNGARPGDEALQWDEKGTALVEAVVAFAPETPLSVAQGLRAAPAGRRMSGDTVRLHGPRPQDVVLGGTREVEIVVNSAVVATAKVPADGRKHALRFEIPIEESSWVALRHFPQLHTNPVDIQIGGRPIRASRESALWLAESVDLLWKNRSHFIAEAERQDAREAYQRAAALYREIANESL